MKKNMRNNEGTAARNDLTELVFILDRSGSMAGLESDTIGGFNAMIAEQKQLFDSTFAYDVIIQKLLALFDD